MSFSFSPRALRHIDEIYNHIAHDNPTAAQRVVDRIYAVAAFLAEYPRSGHPTGMRDSRVFPTHPYPYLIFFRQVPGRDEIRILRVRHTARRPLFLNDPTAGFVHETPPPGVP
jgi:toxin ParE1/3/4